MSAADDVARMLTLVPWLLERPGASVSETAEAFGVDERTIRQDLERLDFCGLPGLRGGDLFEVDLVADRIVVRMADELRRPLRLTPREALRLILTVAAVAEAFGDELPALRSAVDKVREAAGLPRSMAVQIAGDEGGALATLRRSITGGRQVRLAYRGRNDPEPVDRVVDPWSLHVADGAWYLHGHDHRAGAARTFRLDRIVRVEDTGAATTVPAPPEPPGPPAYTPGPDDVEVELLLRPRGRFVADAVTPDLREERGDGALRLVLRTDAPRFIERLVLLAGGEAEVVRPAELRAAVNAVAARALERY